MPRTVHITKDITTKSWPTRVFISRVNHKYISINILDNGKYLSKVSTKQGYQIECDSWGIVATLAMIVIGGLSEKVFFFR